MLPVSTKTAVVDGREWHFEYYRDDVYGATLYDDIRRGWAYVLFVREGSQMPFAAIDHDYGFADQPGAINDLRKAASRRL